MKMKKIYILLLIVLMALTLTACGDNDAESQETKDTEKVSKTTAEDTSFSDVLNTSEGVDNYYFELEMTSQDQVINTKMWVMGSDAKIESAGQILYYFVSQSTMAAYSEDTNQLIVMQLEGMEETETPFTIADDLDSSTFDSIYYKGTENLDGKTVYVYEYSAADIQAKYYVWADTGIIIKMETEADGYAVSYYFKDMTVNEVTKADFEYPAGAQIVDMGSLTLD